MCGVPWHRLATQQGDPSHGCFAVAWANYRTMVVHRAGLGGVWLDYQHGVWRAAQPRYPPAGSGDRAPGEHALPGLLDQLVLFQVYHNFVLPHASLRQRLLVPEATSGDGSARVWRPCTPAMAAGLTDNVWSLKEVLFYRVPPWPQP